MFDRDAAGTLRYACRICFLLWRERAIFAREESNSMNSGWLARSQDVPVDKTVVHFSIEQADWNGGLAI
jgi:hypothetical protein